MTRLAPAVVLAATLVWASAAQAQPEITVSEIIDIAVSGVGSPYVWGAGCWDPANRSRLGADCSGYVAKTWQVPDRSAVTTCSHPYSTWNFYNETTHWDNVDRGSAIPADAFVRRADGAGHIVLFASGDPWGNSEAYEARGTAYGIVHRTRTFDSTYHVRRRRNIVPEGPPPLEAEFVGQGSDAEADPTGEAHFRVCAGDEVTFWFEVRDVGGASWVDWSVYDGGLWGQAVRLGVPTDTADPLTGLSRVSINDASNYDVHPPTWEPPGGDCNDEVFCQRTVFTMQGRAPTTAGVVVTSWRLVDEWRAWFGPEMWLSFRVEDCPEPEPPEETPPEEPEPPEETPPEELEPPAEVEPPEGTPLEEIEPPNDGAPGDGDDPWSPPLDGSDGASPYLAPGLSGGCSLVGAAHGGGARKGSLWLLMALSLMVVRPLRWRR